MAATIVITDNVLWREAAVPMSSPPLAPGLDAGRTAGNMRAKMAPTPTTMLVPVATNAHPSRPTLVSTTATATATTDARPMASGTQPGSSPGTGGRPATTSQATSPPTNAVAPAPVT